MRFPKKQWPQYVQILKMSFKILIWIVLSMCNLAKVHTIKMENVAITQAKFPCDLLQTIAIIPQKMETSFVCSRINAIIKVEPCVKLFFVFFFLNKML